MNKKLEQKINQGYDLDLGKIFDHSIALFKKTALLSGITYFIFMVIILAIYFAFFALQYDFSDFEKGMLEIQNNANSLSAQLYNAIFGTVINTIFAPLTAGFLYVNHLANQNKEFSIGTYFEFYSNKFFKDIILNQLIIAVIMNALATLFVIIDQTFMSLVLQIILFLYTFYTIPLIIFENQNFMQALSISPKLYLKQPFLIPVLVLIGGIGAIIGLLALCIGIFFTIPYFYSLMYAMYNYGIGFDDTDSIHEIGTDIYKN